MGKSKQPSDRVRAVQDRRRSGGHGLHKDRRLKRLNTRGAVLRTALRDA